MAKLFDISGRVFGRWTVLEHVGRGRWRCACECGAAGVRKGTELRYGHTRSCGCLRIDRLLERVVKHGESRGGKRSAEYTIWKSMKTRCFNAADDGFKWYGSRGITVCDEWRNSYETFLRDMGRRPTPKHSLDRKDNDGNYEPSNCRWATLGEQARNRRNTVKITIDGRTLCATDWAIEVGLDVSEICRRVKEGSVGLDIITRRPYGPKRKRPCV